MFDNLIGNRERNLGNMLRDAEWNVILLDHSRAFGVGTELPQKMRRIDAAFWARIESLTRPQLDAALRAWLGEPEIQAILDRRDRMRSRDQVAAAVAQQWCRAARARSEHASWPMIPKTIAHYEILAPIGEGGMGVVYRALDTRLGRPVAVKLLSPEGAIDGERRKRFVQEARAASALNHPHIITIYDIGQAEGVDFIAMEYVAGPSLARRSHRAGCRVEEALQYARPDRRRAGGRARRRDPASRPQAGQHHGRHGWRQAVDQGARFRAREADRVRRLQAHRRASLHGERRRGRSSPDRGRDDPRHGRLHVARAGRGQTCGRAVGCLLVRRGALRNDHGPSCIQRRDEDVHAGGDPHERARTAEPA